MVNQLPDMKLAAKNLRRVRRFRDITQKQLASASGVATSQISSVERGQNRPLFETIHRLAAGLGLSVEGLLTWHPSHEPEYSSMAQPATSRVVEGTPYPDGCACNNAGGPPIAGHSGRQPAHENRSGHQYSHLEDGAARVRCTEA